jgi:hypothetical protein
MAFDSATFERGARQGRRKSGIVADGMGPASGWEFRGAIVVAMAVGLPALACSSSSAPRDAVCKTSGTCPNDPAPVPLDVMTCEQFLADARCGDLFTAWLQCTEAVEVCTAAGKMDESATDAAIAARCATADAAYSKCRDAEITCGIAGNLAARATHPLHASTSAPMPQRLAATR